jgi:hypothetical protein
MQTYAPRRRRGIEVRPSEVRRRGRERFGVQTDRALAERLGFHPVNLSKLFHGQQPSGIVIATLLDALDAKFEDLFLIVPLKSEAASP